MSELPSWQFPGGPASAAYLVLDAVRRRLNQRLVDYLGQRMQRSGAVVLEAGSGPASGSSCFLRRPAVRLSVATDLDIAALREARKRDPALPAVVADLTRLPFRTGSIDLVWSSSTLEHLEARDRALVEMRRVLRCGGRIFVGVPYRYGPLGFQRWIARTAVGHWIGTVFGSGELKRVLESVDLQPVATRIYFLAFFVGVLAVKPDERSPIPSGREVFGDRG